LGDPDVGRAAFAHHVRHASDLVGDFFVRAVGFGEQDGARLEVVARVYEVFDGARGEPVHHLEARGHDAGADHVRHRHARALHVGERGHDHLRGLGFGQELHGDFEDHSEQAL
jgi:hypothetical protein